jgi:hypothetical protein
LAQEVAAGIDPSEWLDPSPAPRHYRHKATGGTSMIGRQMVSLAALVAAFAVSPVWAQTPLSMSETEVASPALPAILSPRERAEVENRILAERLDTVLPGLMREQGIDLWLLMAREYFEEPVVASMLDAENMHARRRTILILHDPGEGKPIERAVRTCLEP